jgi:16S rRNA (uracil1498-N3)-methyltransferase
LHLDEQASHHVARVLRARIDDELTLFNGQGGGEYKAIIKAMDKKKVEVEITEYIDRDAESPLDIHLAQGIARGEKMDFIIQKAVELGVKTFIPLITERCNVKLSNEREEKRLQHWQAVAISACEQSGRNQLPIILAPQLLHDWLAAENSGLRLVLSPHVEDKLPVQNLQQKVVLLIGPEGGLSQQEINLAIKQGFLPWNLGPRILRTETAPLAAMSVLQYCFGDFK